MKIVVVLLLLLPSLALAGEFGSLTCNECHFKEKIMRGGTRHDAMMGQTRIAFFCRKTKKLVERIVVTNPHQKKPKAAVDVTPVATETPRLVSAKSEFHVYTDVSCLDGLIPVDYYLQNPKVPCPVCGKGPVEFTSEGFAD